ncbi:MAG TPA: DUF1015 domain-containing protein [Candidatus Binatia bacterium]|nr:DUF1015 domain-containing protein [Candidatus Binatia bacterium]
MELRPFRALRYDWNRVAIAEVVAPPYDVIDDAQRDRLYARHPHNVVRLILNRDVDRYTSAASHSAEWIDGGILRPDDTAALWLYVQNFAHDECAFERTGVIGTVRLEPFSDGHIRPHERTLSGPKEDRLRLLEACRINLSPIFGLYANQDHALDEAREVAARHAPQVDVVDDQTVRHRLWRLASDAVLANLSGTLANETIFIADGHHRYETALAYRDRLRAGGQLAADDPANFILMYLCSMNDPGLLVLPTHRILRSLPSFDRREFVVEMRKTFQVRSLPRSASGRRDLLRSLARTDSLPRFGVVIQGDDALYEIGLPSFAAIDRTAPELPPVVRQLDVTILDRLILRDLLGLDADQAARAGQIRFSHDDDDAFASIDGNAAQIAFILGPPDLAQVQAVCLSGETMPQKSTYFYPKLLSGLLFNPLTAEPDASRPRAAVADG